MKSSLPIRLALLALGVQQVSSLSAPRTGPLPDLLPHAVPYSNLPPVTPPADCVPVARQVHDKFYCGNGGTLKYPHPLNSSTVMNLEQCESLCMNDAACISLGYLAQNGTCQLYNASLETQGYSMSTSRTSPVYYNTHCFDCNLIPNGNFENGTILPFTYAAQEGGDFVPNPRKNFNGSIDIISPGFQSQYAAAITLVGRNVVGLVEVGGGIVTVPGKQYAVSVDLKANTPNCAFGVETTEYYPMFLGKCRDGHGTPIAHGSYQHYTRSFVATNTTDIVAMVFCCTNAKNDIVMEVDNIAVVPYRQEIFSHKTPALGSNIVTDPNFESGGFSNYNITTVGFGASAPSIDSTVYYGNATQSLEVVLAPSNEIIISQYIPTQTGVVYEVSAAVMTDQRPGTCLNYFIMAHNYTQGTTDLRLEANTNQPPIKSKRNEWGVVTGLLSAFEPGLLGISYVFYCPYSNTNATLHVDALSVVPLST